ncbi:MAG: PhzF family phenazine biosynthesis protein [Acidobacteriota bacterium]|jgi:trans-2,3-dihydro-3-hydroxyanthranilate isomerase
MSSRTYRFRVVDVFTDRPLEGNALAVFPDAKGLDKATMQKVAKELNLSETTFVFPATRADCSACVRIFTPLKEMAFAGHPTIGTSFVLLEEGILPEDSTHFMLEEQVGPVPIRVDTGDNPLIWLSTPPILEGRTFDRAVCAQALGLNASDFLDITPQLLNAGNPTVFIALKDKDSVDRSWIDSRGSIAIKGGNQEPACVFVFTPTPEGAYSRMFAPEYGIPEDPATGSSTGPLAAFMINHGLVSGNAGTQFISEQGTKMGRRSILHVYVHGEAGQDGIDVGGKVVSVAEAEMRL